MRKRQVLKRPGIKKWNKRIGALCTGALIFALSSYGFGRDINLDALYVKQSSKSLERISRQKLEVYAIIGASEIDSGVIFAGWISGDEVLYVKEIPDSSQNAVLLHSLPINKKSEVARLKGTVTAARCATGGFMVLKRLMIGTGGMPGSEMLVVEVKTGKVTSFKSEFPFMDFDIPREGNSVIFETKTGIEEFFPGSGVRKTVLEKQRYADISQKTGPTVPLLSPDRNALLLMSGGGGSYDALLIHKGSRTPVTGITSASEVVWTGPRTLMHRSGSAGNYGVVILTLDGTRPIGILGKSMNTNLGFSPHAGIASMQQDGLACIYYPEEKKLLQLGIEGEDISFDPVGSRFISIFNKRLFITTLRQVQKRQLELARVWESLREAYMKLRDNKADFANDYSLEYLNRKINAYSALLEGSR